MFNKLASQSLANEFSLNWKLQNNNLIPDKARLKKIQFSSITCAYFLVPLLSYIVIEYEGHFRPNNT